MYTRYIDRRHQAVDQLTAFWILIGAGFHTDPAPVATQSRTVSALAANWWGSERQHLCSSTLAGGIGIHLISDEGRKMARMGQDWQLKHRCKTPSPSRGALLLIPSHDLFPFRGLVQGPEATSG
jgi:hypothetical protein